MRDVDDVRESPGLERLRCSNGRDSQVTYHDPHVPRLVRGGMPVQESVPMTAEVLANRRLLIVTDHTGIDWEVIAHARPAGCRYVQCVMSSPGTASEDRPSVISVNEIHPPVCLASSVDADGPRAPGSVACASRSEVHPRRSLPGDGGTANSEKPAEKRTALMLAKQGPRLHLLTRTGLPDASFRGQTDGSRGRPPSVRVMGE